ncbi:beta-lactamase superfamily II metal-dependent hydrolase [Bradyrhizobium sp. USDA 3240]
MPYEIDFLRVGDGNGDAIIIKWGDTKDGPYSLNVIDGGFADTGDQIISHIERYHTKNAIIANVVLTHADNDHATGLIKVLEHPAFTVENLWINRPWDYVDDVIDHFHGAYTRDGLIKRMRDMHPYLVEMEAIAAKRGLAVRAPLQGASIGPFTVLAPSRARYIQLIPDLDKTPQAYKSEFGSGLLGTFGSALKAVVDGIKEALDVETLDNNPPATSASNETSVVQMAMFGAKRVLLTGDVGPGGLNEAADFAEKLGLSHSPDLVQIPHHGSRRNVTPAVLDRWLGSFPAERRGDAIASIGVSKADYPRKKVSNAFIRRGYDVYRTQDGWINFYDGYDRRPDMGYASAMPFSEDVEDE